MAPSSPALQVLHAAFIPFGDILDVQIPLDYETEKHRGTTSGRGLGAGGGDVQIPLAEKHRGITTTTVVALLLPVKGLFRPGRQLIL